MRNDEAAMLFDRGFALSATGQSLDGLAASTVTAPPDMRDEICHGRGRAGAMAMEEEFVNSALAQGSATALAGRAGGPMLAAPMAPPPSSSTQEAAAAPVPVFVGPKPGWNGPVLAASDDVEEPSSVTAYSPDKPKPDEAAAPLALKSAVKTPARIQAAACDAAGARAHGGDVAACGQKVASSINRPHRLTGA